MPEHLTKSPPVAPPHWVPHPTAELINNLAKEPRLREMAAGYMGKLAAKADRWWEIEGKEKYKNNPIPGLEPDSRSESELEEEMRQEILENKDGDSSEEEVPWFKGSKWMPPEAWHCLPRYYPFDRDTDEEIVPLRPESKELVSHMDLNKKMWKCAEKGQTKIALACIRAGADVNCLDYTAPYNHTAVLWAAWGGHPETLEMLVREGGRLDVRDRDQGGPMHVAARNGHVDTIEKLFELTDGDLYQRDTFNRLPIHVAAMAKQAFAVERLAELGSNVNAIDFRMETPLHLAAYCGSLPCAEKLMELGADPLARNIENQMPIDIANLTYNKKVYYYLERFVGKQCIFDRLPDGTFRCGLRHLDEPTELYHRVDQDHLLDYDAPENTAWAWEDEFLKKPVRKLEPEELHQDTSRWEEAIKQKVTLFPHEESLDSQEEAAQAPKAIHAPQDDVDEALEGGGGDAEFGGPWYDPSKRVGDDCWVDSESDPSDPKLAAEVQRERDLRLKREHRYHVREWEDLKAKLLAEGGEWDSDMNRILNPGPPRQLPQSRRLRENADALLRELESGHGSAGPREESQLTRRATPRPLKPFTEMALRGDAAPPFLRRFQNGKVTPPEGHGLSEVVDLEYLI